MANSRYRQYLARLHSWLGGALHPLLFGYSTRLFLPRFLFRWRAVVETVCGLGLSPSKVKILGLLWAGAPTRVPGPPNTRPRPWRRFFRAWYFCLMRMTAYRVEEKLGFRVWLSVCSFSHSSSLWVSPFISPSV